MSQGYAVIFAAWSLSKKFSSMVKEEICLLHPLEVEKVPIQLSLIKGINVLMAPLLILFILSNHTGAINANIV